MHIIEMATEGSTAWEGGEGYERCRRRRGSSGCLTLAKREKGGQKDEYGVEMHVEIWSALLITIEWMVVTLMTRRKSVWEQSYDHEPDLRDVTFRTNCAGCCPT